jgi:hypothetical protein
MTKATEVCGNIMGYISGVSGGVFAYDGRIFGYDFDPLEAVIIEFLNNAG